MDIQSLEYWQLWVFLLCGLAVLFAGYKIKKIAFFIVWFIIGFRLTGFLMPTLNNLVPEIATNQLWQVLLPVAGGLLLGFLGFTIEKLCVAGIVFGLTMVITVQYFGTEIQTIAIGAVVGVLLAMAAVAMIKPAIIISTACAGGFGVTIALLTLFPELDKVVLYWPMLIGISLLGMLVQFKSTKGRW